MGFRKATINDLNALSNLEKECFLVPYNEKDIEYELKDNPFSETIVYEINGEIVGYLIYLITFDSASIVRIGVKKNYRRQNIASLLIQESEKDLKENNVEFYTLEVRSSNESAYNLYVKNGFLKITIKKKYYEDGEDAIYMMKGEI